jgi:hypothetical protein
MLSVAGALAGLLVLVGCTDDSSKSDARETVPRLVDASDALQRQCVAAAEKLGFAVPCPRRVPALRGAAMDCSRPRLMQSGESRAPCVGLAGERPAEIFFVDFTGFDVPAAYVGIDGKREGHLIIEARRHADSPPRPCFDGVEREAPPIAGRPITRYACPSRSARMERLIRHGEGAHTDHVLFAWGGSGIDYVASAHGDTAANARLITQIVESIDIVG